MALPAESQVVGSAATSGARSENREDVAVAASAASGDGLNGAASGASSPVSIGSNPVGSVTFRDDQHSQDSGGSLINKPTTRRF